MSRLVNFVKKFIPNEPPTQLGRWNIEVCTKRVNNKIDSSNEDHCGPCGQYAKGNNHTQLSHARVRKIGLKYKPVNHIEYE